MTTEVEPGAPAVAKSRPKSIWHLPVELFAPGLHYPHTAKYTFITDRLWAHIEQGEGCWPWRGERGPKGYGQLVIEPSELTGWRRYRYRAHRAAWESVHGPVPDGKIICHRCNVRLCCNPAHLYAGTPRDNARDLMLSGRHCTAKLTADRVQMVRAALANGHGPKRVARAFGVNYDTVRRIRRGASYRWVPELAPAAEVAGEKAVTLAS